MTFDARVDRLNRIAKELRIHVLDMAHRAARSHRGSASAADFVAALYFDLMNIDPATPNWDDRDRFVLSKGHVCPIWYALTGPCAAFSTRNSRRCARTTAPPAVRPPDRHLPTGTDACRVAVFGPRRPRASPWTAN